MAILILQDDLDGNKVIVVPESFAKLRHLELGDEITLTFRPLTDTFAGLIRDGVDSLNWQNYPTYQDTYQIVGLYARTKSYAYYAYIPTNSLQPGFTSSMNPFFLWDNDYSFVLDSSRHETEFLQAYKDPLEELGINLTFLPNNGPVYWSAVDPIRHSMAANLLVYGLLMLLAILLAVFLYLMAHRKNYAIMRALGVPAEQANKQAIWPLLMLGGIGIFPGGLPSWSYALTQAKVSLSSLPLPSGISPSSNLSPSVLIGLCAAIFLLLALFIWLGIVFLSRRPVYELLQGETSRIRGRNKGLGRRNSSDAVIGLHTPATGLHVMSSLPEQPLEQVVIANRRKYTPSSLSGYLFHHALRSWAKSVLIMALALGFLLASAWLRQTMVHNQNEVDWLYDNTVVEADILPVDSSSSSGFVYLDAVNSALDSGFVESSILEAVSSWFEIKRTDTHAAYPGYYSVHAYNNPEAFYSDLPDPASLVFASGWDTNLFVMSWTLEDIQATGIPAIFPSTLLAQLQLNVGETISITSQSGHTYPCIIVGQYTGGLSIAIPLSALEVTDGSQTIFTVAHFILDPEKNRDLEQLRTEMEKPMNAYGGQVRFLIWDEELRLVVAQLEKNLSLLEVFYPVLIGVSVLIGAGLSFLLLLQSARDAAILRVLGTTRTVVRFTLVIEPFILSVVGVILGFGIACTLWISSNLVTAGSLLVSAGFYLIGVLAGSVAGTISITNQKPIELLQVKE